MLKRIVCVSSENVTGKTGTSTLGRWHWKSDKPHNTTNNTRKTRSDTEKQRKPLVTGTVVRIISLSHMCPCMHIRKIAEQVNMLPVRLVHENVGLRTNFTSETTIKVETGEGAHGNRTIPGELHDTKH